MPTEREELLDRMRRLPDRIARLVEDKSKDELTRAGAGGEWGAVEHLAHLRDFDETTVERVKQIITGTQPELEAFDTDLRAIELDYHAQDPAEVLQGFRDIRQQLLEFLADLPDESWALTAQHPTVGTLTLEALIQNLDEHDHGHYRVLRDDIL